MAEKVIPVAKQALGPAAMGFDRNRIVLVMPESGEHCLTKTQGNVRRTSVLHIATHAECLVGQPEDSFTLFSNCDRWRLTNVNADLLNLTQVDLVVLSACETEVDNTFGNGDEILGFGYLMQAAGGGKGHHPLPVGRG